MSMKTNMRMTPRICHGKGSEEALELVASDGGMQAYHRQLRAILFNLSAEAEDSTEFRGCLRPARRWYTDTASVQQPCI